MKSIGWGGLLDEMCYPVCITIAEEAIIKEMGLYLCNWRKWRDNKGRLRFSKPEWDAFLQENPDHIINIGEHENILKKSIPPMQQYGEDCLEKLLITCNNRISYDLCIIIADKMVYKLIDRIRGIGEEISRFQIRVHDRCQVLILPSKNIFSTEDQINLIRNV